MRSPLALLALLLLVLTAASPGIETVAECVDLCPDEPAGQDQCSKDACCSCCIHSGPLSATIAVPSPSLDLAGTAAATDIGPVPPARPTDILHVPKPPAV